jgi:hypothetical protein
MPHSRRTSSAPPSQPVLWAHPLFDDDSFEVGEFFKARATKFGKKSGYLVRIQPIGDPLGQDEFAEARRSPEQIAKDLADSQEYWRRVNALGGDERQYKIRETVRLAGRFGVTEEELPCLVFRSLTGQPPFPRLAMDAGWCRTPETQVALSRILGEFFASPELRSLLKAAAKHQTRMAALQQYVDNVRAKILKAIPSPSYVASPLSIATGGSPVLVPVCRVITHEYDRPVSAIDLRGLKSRYRTFDLYVDGVSSNVYRKGKRLRLSRGQISLLLALAISPEPVRPFELRPDRTAQDAGRSVKYMQKLRLAVDVSDRRFEYRAIKRSGGKAPESVLFQFAPPPDMTFCFIIPLPHS